MLTLAYIAFAVMGCGYVLVAAFLGHFLDGSDGSGDGHVAHDAGGGHGAESYGVDAGGHGSAAAHDVVAAVFHFPFFSPWRSRRWWGRSAPSA